MVGEADNSLGRTDAELNTLAERQGRISLSFGN